MHPWIQDDSSDTTLMDYDHPHQINNAHDVRNFVRLLVVRSRSPAVLRIQAESGVFRASHIMHTFARPNSAPNASTWWYVVHADEYVYKLIASMDNGSRQKPNASGIFGV